MTIAFSCVVIYVFRRIELLRLGRALMIGRAEDARNNWTELGRRVMDFPLRLHIGAVRHGASVRVRRRAATIRETF